MQVKLKGRESVHLSRWTSNQESIISKHFTRIIRMTLSLNEEDLSLRSWL